MNVFQEKNKPSIVEVGQINNSFSCFLFLLLQIRMGHQVPTLEDISKQVVNQHRAIIAVNGKPPDQYVKAKGYA